MLSSYDYNDIIIIRYYSPERLTTEKMLCNSFLELRSCKNKVLRWRCTEPRWKHRTVDVLQRDTEAAICLYLGCRSCSAWKQPHNAWAWPYTPSPGHHCPRSKPPPSQSDLSSANTILVCLYSGNRDTRDKVNKEHPLRQCVGLLLPK